MREAKKAVNLGVNLDSCLTFGSNDRASDIVFVMKPF